MVDERAGRLSHARTSHHRSSRHTPEPNTGVDNRCRDAVARRALQPMLTDAIFAEMQVCHRVQFCCHSIPFPPHQAQKSQPCITKVNHRCVHIPDPSDIAFAKLGSSCSKQFWPGPSTGLPSMPAAVPWAESRPMLSICAQGLATRVGGSTSGGRGGQGLHFRESIREHMRISGAVRACHRRAHAMRACAQTCVEECGVAPARSASSPNLIPHASLASMAALTAIGKSPGFVQASLVGPVASSPASTYPPLQVPAGAPLRPATRVCTSLSAAL